MGNFLQYTFASFVLLAFLAEWTPTHGQAHGAFIDQACLGRRCSSQQTRKPPKISHRELEMQELDASILFAKAIASFEPEKLDIESDTSLKSLLGSKNFRMEELKKDSHTFFDTLTLYRSQLREAQFFALSRITSKLNAIIGKYWNLTQSTQEYSTSFSMDFTFPLLLLMISLENRLGAIHDLTTMVHYFEDEGLYKSLPGDHEYVIVLLSSAVHYLSEAQKKG